MEKTLSLKAQLSSVMEKLLVSAVTEIDQLVGDYCAVLRLQLTREREDNSGLREQLSRERQDSSGLKEHLTREREDNSGLKEQLRLHTPEGGSIKDEQTGGGAEQLEDLLKRNTVWQNEEADVTKEQEECPPAVHSTAGCQTGECPSHLPGPTSQLCSEPSDPSRDLLTDSRPSLEMQCRLSISPSGSQFTDFGFHVKREAQSPDLQTEGDVLNLGFEIQEGFMFQMNPLPDDPAPPCFSSFPENQHGPGTLNAPHISSHGQHSVDTGASSQPESQLGRRRTGQYRTPLRFKCDYCGKGFPYLSTLKGHRLSHTGERNQVCGQCGMTFIRRSHLKRHEMLHAGIKPFTCQVCGRNFSRRTNLRSHMRIHCM